MEMDLSHALDLLADQGRRLREQWRFDWPEQSQQTACALRFLLRAGSPPTLVAVVGGASSGKSTVFNNLLEGHMASRVTARGHATLGPVMATCEQDRPRVESWLADGLLMPGFPRQDAQLDEEVHGAVDGLSTIYHPFDSLANIILFDLPDFTSEAAAREGETVVVTNEVGSGVVPPAPLGRAYRDLLGSVNQRVAARASRAWILVAGRALELPPAEETP